MREVPSRIVRALTVIALCAAMTGAADVGAQRAPSGPAERAGGARVVTLGPAMTELAELLGRGDDIVAADEDGAARVGRSGVASLGMVRRIAPEAVLRQRPTLVLATPQVPADTRTQLGAARVRTETFDDVVDTTSLWTHVRAVAAALDATPAGEAFVTKTRAELAAVSRPLAAGAPRVLFVYARGAGVTYVGGRGTAADAMIAHAGAVNAARVDGFKPLTAEAVVAARPDVILALADGAASVGGVDGLLRLPGLAATPAGRARRVVTIADDAFNFFSTRPAAAVSAVVNALDGRTRR